MGWVCPNDYNITCGGVSRDPPKLLRDMGTTPLDKNICNTNMDNYFHGEYNERKYFYSVFDNPFVDDKVPNSFVNF